MTSVALSRPRPVRNGELCGMMAIKAAIDAKGEGETRRTVLVPESAHGTNPATAALIGFKVRTVPADTDGTVRVQAVKDLIGPDTAAIMLTNPNTCGLFEPEIVRDRESASRCGGRIFLLRRGEFQTPSLGKGAAPAISGSMPCISNLHKDLLDAPWRRWSGPSGPGGAVTAPRAASRRCPSSRRAPRRVSPSSSTEKDGGREALRAHHRLPGRGGGRGGGGGGRPDGHVCARARLHALARLRRHEAGLPEDAVLNANYIRAGLRDLMSQPFGDKPCMHEALFDDSWLKDTGVSTLDFAKAMIDEGYHPMTVYFPLVAHGAMLVEPTAIGIEILARSVHTPPCAISPRRQSARLLRRANALHKRPFHATSPPASRREPLRAARPSRILKWTPPEPMREAAE